MKLRQPVCWIVVRHSANSIFGRSHLHIAYEVETASLLDRSPTFSKFIFSVEVIFILHMKLSQPVCWITVRHSANSIFGRSHLHIIYEVEAASLLDHSRPFSKFIFSVEVIFILHMKLRQPVCWIVVRHSANSIF